MKRWGIVTSATAVAVIFSGATGAVRAQNTGSLGNPAGMSPGTPGVYDAHPDPKQSNTADQLFVHEAVIGGQAEVQAGKLAAGKAQSEAVKAFANRMVKEHSQAADHLAGIVKGDAYPRTNPLDMDHKVMMDQLSKANGKAFDELYVRAQLMDHQKTVQLYEWIIGNGQDPRLQAYAMDTLPSLMRHLEMAKGLLAQLTGSAP
jgi:putative membrane protein